MRAETEQPMETPPTQRSLPAMLVPWVAAGLTDVYAVLGGWPRPTWWQCLSEVVFLTLAGWVQWRLARGWLRTPLLAPAVMLFFSSAIYAPKTPFQAVCFLLGFALALLGLLRLIETRARVSAVVGACVAVVAVIGSRYVDAVALERPQLAAAGAVFGELIWPLTGMATATGSDAPPIVIISVDTLRTDAAVEMEVVRRLRQRGAYWERAMSTSNWTLPALATLQTGLLPVDHGAGCLAGGHCQGVYDHVRLIAEQLQDAGYATAAVISNPWVTAGTGFARGFDVFIESGNSLNRLLVGGLPAGPHRQDAQHVVDAAIEWLDHAPDRGFYLWVHVFDPHLPYLHAAQGWLHALTATQLRTSLPLTKEERELVRAAYANEVAYTDTQLLRLLDALEQRKILDNGVVVFTSDHGEEFWEHGGVEHGHTHHTEVVDVPLALVAPGVAPGPRSNVASLLDVVPTLRAVAGIEPGGLDLRAELPADRIATAWGGLVERIGCSARDPRWRAIVPDCSGTTEVGEVYDLEVDLAELAPVEPPSGGHVLDVARQVAAPEPADRAAQVNREALRMLGYMPK